MSFVVVASLVAAPGEEEEVARCLGELAAASRQEPGCRFYQPNRSLDDPRSFLVYELYDDRAAADAHWASRHFERLAKGDLLPRLERVEDRHFATVGAEAAGA